jgi:putative endonuclease
MLYYVYLLSSRRNGTLYCGVTNSLLRRVYEHKCKQASEFTRKYSVDRLVCFETHQEVSEAISREKRIKRWRRAWKLNLIETDNPNWRDLYWELGGNDPEKIVPKELQNWKT